MKNSIRFLVLILEILLIALMLMYLTMQVCAAESGPYGPTMDYEATAYCYTGSLTKTGTVPLEGRTVAVDPDVIPLGSTVIVYLDSQLLGIYQAEDTGGLVKGRVIDIYMEDREACREFGRQEVRVQVVQAEG